MHLLCDFSLLRERKDGERSANHGPSEGWSNDRDRESRPTESESRTLNHARVLDNDRDHERRKEERSSESRSSDLKRVTPPSRHANDVARHSTSRGHDGRFDSAFNNVLHPNSLTAKEERREPEKEKPSERLPEQRLPDRIPERIPEMLPERMPERLPERLPERFPPEVMALHQASVINSMNHMNPMMSLLDRRLPGMPFSPLLHMERHPNPQIQGPWDPFRGNLEALHREQQMRLEREYERDRLMRSALHQPMGPIIEHPDRLREREHHDFSRDNPLAMESTIRHLEQERMHRYLEERDRALALREDVERSRLIHATSQDPLNPLNRPSIGGIPPYSRTSSIFSNSLHKNSSPPSTLSAPPPPLVSSAATSNGPSHGGLSHLGPHSHSASPHLTGTRNSSPADSNPSKGKATPDKDSHSR